MPKAWVVSLFILKKITPDNSNWFYIQCYFITKHVINKQMKADVEDEEDEEDAESGDEI